MLRMYFILVLDNTITRKIKLFIVTQIQTYMKKVNTVALFKSITLHHTWGPFLSLAWVLPHLFSVRKNEEDQKILKS